MWAVAFASVIAFMGIGLVDPILTPIGVCSGRKLLSHMDDHAPAAHTPAEAQAIALGDD